MHYLLLAILSSVIVSVVLKIARQYRIDIAQSIAMNYPVAIGLTWLILRPQIKSWGEYQPMLSLFGALGVLLPLVFVVMSRAIQVAGMVKADAAQRLSLFIPIIWTFVFFGEHLTAARMVGVVLAFAALAALLYKPMRAASSASVGTIALPLLGVWVGYGAIDVLFKQLSKLDAQAFAGNLLITFVLAGILVWLYLLIKRTRWDGKSLLVGLLLGALNFANILFYLRAHQALKNSPTTVFAGMNVGVIALATLVGAWMFREKLSRINVLGITLALAAIFCLYYL